MNGDWDPAGRTLFEEVRYLLPSHVAIITPNLMATAWQLQEAGLASYDGGNNYIKEAGADRAATAHRDIQDRNAAICAIHRADHVEICRQ